MTALAFGKESEIDSASAEKEANGYAIAVEHGHARLRRVLGSRHTLAQRANQHHRTAGSGVATALAGIGGTLYPE